MELQPTSETGKGLLPVLKKWMDKSPEFAVDKLKRVFLRYSLQVQNEDGFVTLLYSQSVLDESPSALSERFPTALLRVQYAMETALNKSCVKELVVALELSKNGGVLSGIQKWTEENSKEITEAMKRLSINLAPKRVPKRLMLSELTPGTEVKPRTREINLRLKGKNNAQFSVVEVCNDKIIIGWDKGQIEIYSSTGLGRQTLLNSYRSPVSCLQCTCTEIISGYRDGNICVWNIENGKMEQKLSIQEKRDHARCMRWRAPRLVVGTTGGKVKIWEYCGTFFTLLCSLDEQPAWIRGIMRVDFNEKYLIVQKMQPAGFEDCVDVKDLNGKQIHSISFPSQQCLRSAALDGNCVITLGHDNVARMSDISTATCLKELEGQFSPLSLVDAHDGIFGATGNTDGTARTIIWNVKAVLEGTEGPLADFSHVNVPYNNDGLVFKLGENIIVTGCGFTKPTINVTDFVA